MERRCSMKNHKPKVNPKQEGYTKGSHGGSVYPNTPLKQQGYQGNKKRR